MAELGPDDLTPVGQAGLPDLTQTEFVTAVVGPGTGFGAATLIKRDGRLTSLSGEAGTLGSRPKILYRLNCSPVLPMSLVGSRMSAWFPEAAW